MGLTAPKKPGGEGHTHKFPPVLGDFRGLFCFCSSSSLTKIDGFVSVAPKESPFAVSVSLLTTVSAAAIVIIRYCLFFHQKNKKKKIPLQKKKQMEKKRRERESACSRCPRTNPIWHQSGGKMSRIGCSGGGGGVPPPPPPPPRAAAAAGLEPAAHRGRRAPRGRRGLRAGGRGLVLGRG